MSVRFSEDVIPLTDLKTNPGRVVRHAAESHRPVLLTRRGRGIAVVQSVADYEAAEEERAFMRAVVEGLTDLETGRDVLAARNQGTAWLRVARVCEDLLHRVRVG